MRPTGPPALLWISLILTPATALSEQVQAHPPESTADSLIQMGDREHGRLMPRDALERYEAALAHDSINYEALWKAAREAVNVGMLADQADRKEWYLRAVDCARRAVARRPDGVEGHHWLGVGLGRRALEEGVRTRVRIANEVRGQARRVLELDSLHPGGHHVLGQWHAEVRRLSGIERWVAGKILGGDDFADASWETAGAHLERAVELAPKQLIHRLELARIYLDLDEDELAREQLERILLLPPIEPTDPLHKEEAQRLLREMDAQG